MGVCQSTKKPIIDARRGGQAEYKAKYEEIKQTLGQGEYGLVRLAKIIETGEMRAVKSLKKGVTMKNNVMYSPMKNEDLIGEVAILIALEGKHFNLKLYEVYESPRTIWLVTEYLTGGNLIHWTSKQASVLNSSHVSKICSQLIDAVQFCNQHFIIHRDIKSENVMFVEDCIDSEIRLIDYGASTNKYNASDPSYHNTYAGSPFYISPEMYQRKYRDNTDMWSVGVTIYVLVSGYPVERLQEAFDLMQSPEKRDVKQLPDMPQDLPESFYVMLNDLLTHKQDVRKSAKEMMLCDFMQHHNQINTTQSEGDFSNDPSQNGSGLAMSSARHSRYIQYQKFERMVTTLLASILTKEEYENLRHILQGELKSITPESENQTDVQNKGKLQVVTIKRLLQILKSIGQERVVFMIEELREFSTYTSFPYNITLLAAFNQVSEDEVSNDPSEKLFVSTRPPKKPPRAQVNQSVHGNNVWKSIKSTKPKSNELDTSSPF